MVKLNIIGILRATRNPRNGSCVNYADNCFVSGVNNIQDCIAENNILPEISELKEHYNK